MWSWMFSYFTSQLIVVETILLYHHHEHVWLTADVLQDTNWGTSGRINSSAVQLQAVQRWQGEHSSITLSIRTRRTAEIIQLLSSCSKPPKCWRCADRWTGSAASEDRQELRLTSGINHRSSESLIYTRAAGSYRSRAELLTKFFSDACRQRTKLVLVHGYIWQKRTLRDSEQEQNSNDRKENGEKTTAALETKTGCC